MKSPLAHFIPVFLLGLLLLVSSTCHADKPSRYLQLDSFGRFVNSALYAEGLADFEAITAEVENNIFWKKNKSSENKYQAAFKRSYPYLKDILRDDIPDFVFLIPYLESGWHATKGNPDTDYGYWQMVSEVVAEIKTLDHASAALRNADPNKIRSNLKLSTEAALIHLKRYHFYFRHIANFSEADAWMFSLTAFNWGAGNVKTLLAEMKSKGRNTNDINFDSFYHYLLESSQKHPNDKSMRVALEYLPNLWNLAMLVQIIQKETQDNSANKVLTLNRSSSVSIP
jgi:hypothetical protein